MKTQTLPNLFRFAPLAKSRLSRLNVLFSSVRLKIQVESRSADLKAPDELLDLNGFTQRSGERARRRGRAERDGKAEKRDLQGAPFCKMLS